MKEVIDIVDENDNVIWQDTKKNAHLNKLWHREAAVLIFTYGEESSCLSIKNPEIAQSFKNFFETMWKIAKR